jgi:hypothetical protein
LLERVSSGLLLQKPAEPNFFADEGWPFFFLVRWYQCEQCSSAGNL